jgi:hypothetical protein
LLHKGLIDLRWFESARPVSIHFLGKRQSYKLDTPVKKADEDFQRGAADGKKVLDGEQTA